MSKKILCGKYSSQNKVSECGQWEVLFPHAVTNKPKLKKILYYWFYICKAIK